MHSPARTAVYILLLLAGLSLTPARLLAESLLIAAIGLTAFLLVQVRRTRNGVDYAFAWVALWAVAAVLGAPVVPAFRILGALAGGGL